MRAPGSALASVTMRERARLASWPSSSARRVAIIVSPSPSAKRMTAGRPATRMSVAATSEETSFMKASRSSCGLRDGKRPQVRAARRRDAEHGRCLGGDFDVAKARRVAELGVASDAAVAPLFDGENADAPGDGAHPDDEAVDDVVARRGRPHGRQHAANVGEGGGGRLRRKGAARCRRGRARVRALPTRGARRSGGGRELARVARPARGRRRRADAGGGLAPTGARPERSRSPLADGAASARTAGGGGGPPAVERGFVPARLDGGGRRLSRWGRASSTAGRLPTLPRALWRSLEPPGDRARSAFHSGPPGDRGRSAGDPLGTSGRPRALGAPLGTSGRPRPLGAPLGTSGRLVRSAATHPALRGAPARSAAAAGARGDRKRRAGPVRFADGTVGPAGDPRRQSSAPRARAGRPAEATSEGAWRSLGGPVTSRTGWTSTGARLALRTRGIGRSLRSGGALGVA